MRVVAEMGRVLVSTLDEARVLEIVATQAHESLGRARHRHLAAGGGRRPAAPGGRAGAVLRPAHRARPAAQCRRGRGRTGPDRARAGLDGRRAERSAHPAPPGVAALDRGDRRPVHPRGAARSGSTCWARSSCIGRSAQVFSTREVEYLSAFANQIAVALENARLYRALDVRAARLRSLARLAHIVSSSLDMDEVLRAIAEAAGRADRGAAGEHLGRERGHPHARVPHRVRSDGRRRPVQDRRLRRGRGGLGGRRAPSRSRSRTSRRTRASSPGSGRPSHGITQPARGADRVPGHAAGGALPQRASADPARPRRRAAPRELRGAGGRGHPQRGPLRRDPRPARGEPRAPGGGRDPQLHAGLEAAAARGHDEDRPGVPGGPLLHPALGRRPRGAAHVPVRRRSPGPRDLGPVPSHGRERCPRGRRCTRARWRRGGP